MSLSQLELINAALIKIGGFKITALNDGSAEADIAATLYGPVRDALLSFYPWTFATTQTTLTTPTTPPTADYAYAFALPVDHVRTLSVGEAGAGSGLTYRLMNNRIETDAAALVLTYVRRVVEAAQPAYFDLVLIAKLAAEMAVPLTENATRAEAMYRLAEQELARARSIDAQQDTPSRLGRYSLIDVRG
jgi:hypothetical protein